MKTIKTDFFAVIILCIPIGDLNHKAAAGDLCCDHQW